MPAGINELIAQLGDRSAYVRQRACRQLQANLTTDPIHKVQIVNAAKSLLADSNKYVRLAAAPLMAHYAPDEPGTIDVVAALLRDEHRDIKIAAANTLAAFGSKAKPALPALRELLKDPLPPVVRQAEAAIQKIEK